MPGRCGYIPGRGGMPGSGVRTGCEGSGRGPPGVGRAVEPGYGGRFGAPAGRGGIGGAAGRALGTPVCAAAPPAAARVAAGLAGRSVLGAGLGPAGYVFAIMHLLTHGFFKAGLFLGAGSVMHATNDETDMRRYGGLRPYMPI